MKRSPLKRTTPMRRRSRKKVDQAALDRLVDKLVADHATPVRLSHAGEQLFAAATKESEERRHWVHCQPCVFGRVTGDPCDGKPMQEMHCDRDKGTGIKSPRPTFAGCGRHHDMVSGAAKHPSVMPMEKLWRRAFEALASEATEREWQETVAHERKREGL